MPIRFACPHCHQKLSVSSRKAGVRVACPNCKQPLKIPQPRPQPELAPVPSAPTRVEAPERSKRRMGELPSVERTAAAAQASTVQASAAQASAAPSPAAPAVSSPSISPPADSPPVRPAAEPSATAPPLAEEATHEAADDDANLFAQFTFDDDSELYYDTSEPSGEAAQPATIDYDRVSVPRLMLYLQGALLGIVALVCFSIGLVTGSAFFSAGPTGPVAAQPCEISGSISYTTGNRLLPDAGAVVVALPQTERLQERVGVVGLRPGDPPPEPLERGVEIIRTIGGAYTRADDQGRFQLRLPDRGNYFVLVVSNHAQEASLDEIKTPDLLQMGRYFDAPADLLGKQKYQWSETTLRADRKLNVDF